MIKHEAGVATETIGLLAEGGKLSLTALSRLAILTTKVGVAIPLGIGAGLGYAASKITSPSPEDIKATERRLELARIKTMTKENRRKTALEAEKERANAGA